MSSKLRIRHGNEAFQYEKPSKPLVRHILYRDDVVLLLGSEKAGKSILAQQLAFCCTSGDKFLGKYDVIEPLNVVYFQTEGKENEGVDRRIRMETGVPINKSRYAHFYKKFFPIDIDAYRDFLVKGIEMLPWAPQLLIIDALYMAMTGDLIDNKEVRKLIANVSYVIEKFDLTTIVVHHETKQEYDKETHEPIDKGDKASYGSVFLRAWVDHILYLKKIGGRTCILRCDTQRSGKMLEKETLVLIGDAKSDNAHEPLHFEINEEHNATAQAVLAMLRIQKSLTTEELSKTLGLAHSTIYKATRQLISDKKIVEPKKGVFQLCEK